MPSGISPGLMLVQNSSIFFIKYPSRKPHRGALRACRPYNGEGDRGDPWRPGALPPANRARPARGSAHRAVRHPPLYYSTRSYDIFPFADALPKCVFSFSGKLEKRRHPTDSIFAADMNCALFCKIELLIKTRRIYVFIFFLNGLKKEVINSTCTQVRECILLEIKFQVGIATVFVWGFKSTQIVSVWMEREGFPDFSASYYLPLTEQIPYAYLCFNNADTRIVMI